MIEYFAPFEAQNESEKITKFIMNFYRIKGMDKLIQNQKSIN